ncbi:MAG: MTH938/NDUFAF3 family protein [Proteobacteria bacterium]|nr:MTH938/NDUFAF3 family protein [Pseudomonadota bacterium]
MHLIENTTTDINIINSVTTTELTINADNYQQSLILSNQQIVVDLNLISIDSLTPQHIEQLLLSNPDLIILGTGTTQKFPNTNLLSPIVQHNIGFEVMNNQAAARTYNVLVTEERKVACLLVL